MRRRLAAWALLASTGALAQPAPRAPRERRSCAVAQHPLPTALAELLDPASPVSVAALREGAFVAFRDRDGALRVARTDDELAPRGDLRALGDGVTDFSMTATREGVALAWVEGGSTLLLARVDGENELENVPRVLAASGERIERVTLARVGDDLAVAWSTRDAPRTFAVRTDARAVPRGGAQGMGEGRVRELRAQGDIGALTLGLEGPGGEVWAVSLDDRGREIARARWPASALGPVAFDGASWAVHLGAAGLPTLSRAGAAIPPEFPVAGARLDLVVVREGVAVAVTSDARAGRATVTRLDLGGISLAPFALRAPPASAEALAVLPDGDVLTVAREGRRVLVLRARCGR